MFFTARLWWRVKDPVAWAERIVGREKAYQTLTNEVKVFGAIGTIALVGATYYYIGRQNILAFVIALNPISWGLFYGVLASQNYLKAMRALVLERRALLERIHDLENACGVAGEAE